MAKGDNPTAPLQAGASFAGAANAMGMSPFPSLYQGTPNWNGIMPSPDAMQHLLQYKGPGVPNASIPINNTMTNARQAYNPNPEMDRAGAIAPSSGFDMNNKFNYAQPPTMKPF